MKMFGQATSPARERRAANGNPRRGVVIVVLGIGLLTVMMGFVAFSVDIGAITLEKAKVQNAVDAAALAAAQEIQIAINEAASQVSAQGGNIANYVDSINAIAITKARQKAVDVAAMNGVTISGTSDVSFFNRIPNGTGGWTNSTNPPYNVVRVQATSTLKLSFAPVIGYSTSSVNAVALATVESRDIVLVLDFSGSMADDSLWAARSKLGKEAVESNLDDIWKALAASGVKFKNKPSKLKFPNITSSGQSVFGQIKVGEGTHMPIGVGTAPLMAAVAQYAFNSNGSLRSTSDVINSINNLSTSQVSSQANASTKSKVSNLMSKASKSWLESVTSGINSSRRTAAWQGVTETKARDFASAMSTDQQTWVYNKMANEAALGQADYLGLLETSGSDPATPYPQAGGSWNSNGSFSENNMPNMSTTQTRWRDYIKYVNTDSDVNGAGYRSKFGTRTLAEYMLSNKLNHTASEDLYRAPMYPFHAMREGTSLFIDFLNGLEFGDHLGIVSYDDDARVESIINGEEVITDDYEALDEIQRARSAAYYSSYTAIAKGMKEARSLLLTKGRPGAQKVMIVLTDGNANRFVDDFTDMPDGWNWAEWTDLDDDGDADYVPPNYNPSQNQAWFDPERAAKNVFYEASLAIAKGITVHSLSVGAGADRAMMQALAFVGRGVHVDVPGGFSISEMEEEMLQAFAQIAASVPPAKLLHE